MENVLVIVVLYDLTAGLSEAVRNLIALSRSLPRMTILLYDNSPKRNPLYMGNSFLNAVYVHDGRNLGLANAYNYGVQYAKDNSKEWIMLLDQDTLLTSNYLHEVSLTLKNMPTTDVVAIVPLLFCRNRHVSPMLNRSEQNVWWFQKPVKESGCYEGYITAFNSGTLLNAEFMSFIGGFSEKYPLDRLDYWYFHQIYKHRKKVYVLDATLEHDLSVLDYEKNMTVERYLMILKSELTFAKETGWQSVLLYKLLVICRFFKQLLLLRNKKYAWLTFQQIWK